MVDLFQVDDYLCNHTEKEAWEKLNDEAKAGLLEMAEHYINGAFDLRDGAKDSLNYFHAVCEQAIHFLVFDKERLKLQREGVSSYKFDDMSFQMDNSIISPIVHSFLKKYIYKRLGEIV